MIFSFHIYLLYKYRAYFILCVSLEAEIQEEGNGQEQNNEQVFENTEHPGLESEQTVGEESINIESVLQENTATDDEGENQKDGGELSESADEAAETAASTSGKLSPTSHHKEIQRKRAQRKKLDDNMIAEEDGQVCVELKNN